MDRVAVSTPESLGEGRGEGRKEWWDEHWCERRVRKRPSCGAARTHELARRPRVETYLGSRSPTRSPE